MPSQPRRLDVYLHSKNLPTYAVGRVIPRLLKDTYRPLQNHSHTGIIYFKREVFMKRAPLITSLFLILCLGCGICEAELFNRDDDSKLGDALMGGLMGAGIGAAIGSASGEAGKGAGIGAGIGALGGLLLGEMRRSAERRRLYQGNSSYQGARYPAVTDKSKSSGSSAGAASEPGRRKRVIREYDEYGNVVSEREEYIDKE